MTELTIFTTDNPVAVLTDEAKYSEFYKRVKAEVSAFVPDTSTVKGRGEIAAMAYKVTRTKTAIDAAGKKLNEDARLKINAVDASRRKIREELDALADEVRKPLTDWEGAEERRKINVAMILGTITDCVGYPGDSTEIQGHIDRLNAIEIDPDLFHDGTHEAVMLKSSSLGALDTRLRAAMQAEADARELAALRAANEERERNERARAEQEERDRQHAQQIAREEAEAEARRTAEAERREREASEAKEREERVVEAARQEEQRKAAEAHAKELAAVQAERDRLAKIEADRVAEEKRIAAETFAREKDKLHRSKVMGEVKAALMTCGADEETAKKIVLTIKAGEIPHVTLRF